MIMVIGSHESDFDLYSIHSEYFRYEKIRKISTDVQCIQERYIGGFGQRKGKGKSSHYKIISKKNKSVIKIK